MNTNLPEVVQTVTDVANVDRGNIFSRGFFRRVPEKRLEVQERIYTTFLECNKETTLAKTEAERGLEQIRMELDGRLQVARMDYSFKRVELELKTLENLCNNYGLDADTATDLFEKIIKK